MFTFITSEVQDCIALIGAYPVNLSKLLLYALFQLDDVSHLKKKKKRLQYEKMNDECVCQPEPKSKT